MIKNKQEETFIFFTFTAELLEENMNYNKNEILEVQWIEIEEIKNMKYEQLRDYDMTIKAIEYIQNNNIYPLEIIENM